MKAPGRIFLLVTGIIYIVAGVSGIISGLFLEILSQTVDGVGDMVGVQGAGSGFGLLAFFSLAAGIFSLIMGIMGIVHRNTLEKASMLIAFGVIDMIIDVISMIATGTFSIAMILLFALPICYIVGAYKNKNAQAV